MQSHNPCNHWPDMKPPTAAHFTLSTLLKNETSHQTQRPKHCARAHAPPHCLTLHFDTTNRKHTLSRVKHTTGGAGRDRTDDPRLAKPMLSQLSYSPISDFSRRTRLINMVGLVGFEPTTPALSRRCSNQLSYRPSYTARETSFTSCSRLFLFSDNR